MHSNTRQTSNTKIINNMLKAINGEYSAIYCYEHLANQAPNIEVKNRILEIRNDEIRHYNEFVQIYTSLTGNHPSPQITEQCPSSFREGIHAAFKDEQETVDSYLDIADRAQDMHIKEIFRRAAVDEQNHAVWFLYFMLRK